MKNVCSYTENTTVHMVTIVEDLSSHLVNTLFRIRVCVKHERFSNDTGLMLFTVMLAWSIMKKRFIYIYIYILVHLHICIFITGILRAE